MFSKEFGQMVPFLLQEALHLFNRHVFNIPCGSTRHQNQKSELQVTALSCTLLHIYLCSLTPRATGQSHTSSNPALPLLDPSSGINWNNLVDAANKAFQQGN